MSQLASSMDLLHGKCAALISQECRFGFGAILWNVFKVLRTNIEREGLNKKKLLS